MQKLLTRGSVLAAALIFGACQDATEPVAVSGSGGSGNDTQCVGVVTGVHDNIVVPAGAACTLDEATVLGNVLALPNSTLLVSSSTINGNVKGDLTGDLILHNATRVEGNFEVKSGSLSAGVFLQSVFIGGDAKIEEYGAISVRDGILVGSFDVLKSPGGMTIEGNSVGGNFKIEDNAGLSAHGNRVGGNMQVFKNRGPVLKNVVGNRVTGNLQCFENDPPIFGGPNVAAKAEGQCF